MTVRRCAAAPETTATSIRDVGRGGAGLRGPSAARRRLPLRRSFRPSEARAPDSCDVRKAVTTPDRLVSKIHALVAGSKKQPLSWLSCNRAGLRGVRRVLGGWAAGPVGSGSRRPRGGDPSFARRSLGRWLRWALARATMCSVIGRPERANMPSGRCSRRGLAVGSFRGVDAHTTGVGGASCGCGNRSSVAV